MIYRRRRTIKFTVRLILMSRDSSFVLLLSLLTVRRDMNQQWRIPSAQDVPPRTSCAMNCDRLYKTSDPRLTLRILFQKEPLGGHILIRFLFLCDVTLGASNAATTRHRGIGARSPLEVCKDDGEIS